MLHWEAFAYITCCSRQCGMCSVPLLCDFVSYPSSYCTLSKCCLKISSRLELVLFIHFCAHEAEGQITFLIVVKPLPACQPLGLEGSLDNSFPSKFTFRKPEHWRLMRFLCNCWCWQLRVKILRERHIAQLLDTFSCTCLVEPCLLRKGVAPWR